MKLLKDILLILFGLAFLSAVLLYLFVPRVMAHAPCDNPIPEVCGYQLVANPYTGKMQTEYVCQ